MAVKTYCNYGLCDEDSANTLEEGDSCERFTYWNDGIQVTIKNITICDIYEDKIVVELEDYEEVTIQVDDIIDWE